jgi:hypothetical protein
LTAGLFVALCVRTVHARDAPRGLSYQADASCPQRAAFAALVLERAPRADLEALDAQNADALVALHGSDTSFTGSLEIRRGDGSFYTREVRATTCSEVSAAIAFILALALNGQNEAPPDPPFPSAPIAPLPPDDLAPRPPPARESGVTWGWAIGAALGARSGIAPSWSMAEELAVEVQAVSDSTLAPTFRLAVIHAGPVTQDDGVGSTEFSWIAGRASGCPLRAHLLPGLELLPCLGFDLGAIGAAGRPATSLGRAADTSSFWADAFGSLRLRFHVLGPVFGELAAELVLPFTTYDFAFDPHTPVYAVPPLSAAGSVGLFGQFP